MASATARRRLLKDLKALTSSEDLVGINAAPVGENIMAWQAVIIGPDGTIWEGGVFELLIDFTEEFPNKAPNIRFVTPMFHPNIYMDGKICLDILQSKWTPILDVAAVLRSIQSLLTDPNPASPANSEAATLYEKDREAYNRKVADCVANSVKELGSEGEDSDSDSDSGSEGSVDEDGDTDLGAAGASGGT